VVERGTDFLLRSTGATASCASEWNGDAVYDMVGNLDEWIADDAGIFVGGFYSRASRQGCEAKISSHAPSYYDYSLGTRCCRGAAGGL
jgi:formylglycine-generating enzyme required for sulfatase activity